MSITKTYNSSGYSYSWDPSTITLSQNYTYNLYNGFGSDNVLDLSSNLSSLAVVISGDVITSKVDDNTYSKTSRFSILVPINAFTSTSGTGITDILTKLDTLPSAVALYSIGYRIKYSVLPIDYLPLGYNAGLLSSNFDQFGCANPYQFFSVAYQCLSTGIAVMGIQYPEMGYSTNSAVGSRLALMDIFDSIFNAGNTISERPYKAISYGDSIGSFLNLAIQHSHPDYFDAYGLFGNNDIYKTAIYACDALYLLNLFFDNGIKINDFSTNSTTRNYQIGENIGKCQDILFAMSPDTAPVWSYYDGDIETTLGITGFGGGLTSAINDIAGQRKSTTGTEGGTLGDPQLVLADFYTNYNAAQRIRGILSQRHSEYLSSYTDITPTTYINGLVSTGVINPLFLLMSSAYLSGFPLKSETYDGISYFGDFIGTGLAIADNFLSPCFLACTALPDIEEIVGGTIYENDTGNYFSQRIPGLKTWLTTLASTYASGSFVPAASGFSDVLLSTIESGRTQITNPTAKEKIESFRYSSDYKTIKREQFNITKPTLLMTAFYDPVATLSQAIRIWQGGKNNNNSNVSLLTTIPWNLDNTTPVRDRTWPFLPQTLSFTSTSANVVYKLTTLVGIAGVTQVGTTNDYNIANVTTKNIESIVYSLNSAASNIALNFQYTINMNDVRELQSSGRLHSNFSVENIMSAIGILVSAASGTPIQTATDTVLAADTSHTLKKYDDIDAEYKGLIYDMTLLFMAYDDLNTIKQEIADKYSDISSKRISLSTNRTNLTNTNNEISVLYSDIAQFETDINSKRTTINGYYTDINTLRSGTAPNKNAQIAAKLDLINTEKNHPTEGLSALLNNLNTKKSELSTAKGLQSTYKEAIALDLGEIDSIKSEIIGLQNTKDVNLSYINSVKLQRNFLKNEFEYIRRTNADRYNL